MTTRDLLGALRAGERPDPEAVARFAAGLADGTVSDAQAGAFAMGVCMGPGLGEAGRVALTRAMAESGDRMRWDLPGPVLDKHSTGGVGDPVSLILAPALAALDVYVPMISGRGLGHTGGTLDKLEALPGVVVEQGEERFRAMVRELGFAIVAASGDLAPADRRLYAIRDVTVTVDQIDLITASILSKKLAAGLDGLVLDVKQGSGAFMQAPDQARALAASLVATARGAGLESAALVTAMDQPLAPVCGNALEIVAVLEVLCGSGDDRLREVTLALGDQLLTLAGQIDGRQRLERVLDSGAAAERFARMIAAMGGPRDVLTDPKLAAAPVIREVCAGRAGYVRCMDGRALGRIVVDLGGGRQRDGDLIDPAVGIDHVVRIGSWLGEHDPLGRVHARSEAEADRAAEALRQAITLGEDYAAPAPLIQETLT
ncbi:thymidine phosphorylase [Palleronia caenipelagi]|uniref:thymidine phosphorylase n=1 Tax=Palleronia caenipelagi TaxID=2489174 RepID=A0A547Q7D7_9RHOB|nr:thymidine phosphorylase [Palleronia caenipelagi]TRD22279.1 thymidine phosphorylase [Palleronia caenipelagi]